MEKNNDDLVKEVTNREDDFAKWYTDIVIKAGLARYSPVRGCMYVEPYGTALWENIRDVLDKEFKRTGHQNVMFPAMMPESLLTKEKEHVEGFAPEVAWITHGGGEELTERLCLRPTSETLFCDYFSKVLHSYRELPLLYNQWANVFRWEKTTRLFLRTTEFFWQEGHTLHETKEEAIKETEQMLKVYKDFANNYLAIPVLTGKKTDKEKFAGADSTYTIEALMPNGYSLQAGTSHFLGNGFAKAYDIKFMGRNGDLQYPYQTSWGISSRIIGAIIMSHGDNSGLVLPPRIAPIQVVVVPVAQHKDGVLDKARELYERISQKYRCKIDESDNTPGWKFAEWEMKGVPLRIEYGPRDIENGVCVAVRRDNREKTIISLDNLESEIQRLLDEVHNGLYEKASKRREELTFTAKSFDDFKEICEKQIGFIKSMWCGDLECEMKLKNELGVTSRCMPFESETIADVCPICGKKASKVVVWGKAY